MADPKVHGPLLTTTKKGDIDTVPLKWRAKAGTVTSTEKVPTDVAPDALTSTLVESSVEQTERNKNTNERDKVNVVLTDVASTMTEYVKTAEGQLGTRTLSLVAEGAALPTIAATTVQAEQNALGNGKAEQVVTTVASVFPQTQVADEGAAAQLDRTIQHFYVNYKRERTSTVTAGTTATPTALAQPTTLAHLAIGTGVVEAQAERIDATKVRNTDTIVSAASLSPEYGVELDEDSGTVKGYSQEVVIAGTAGSSVDGSGNYAEVKPINTRFSIKTSRQLTNFTSRTYGTREYVGNLPRVLTTFTSYAFTARSRRAPYGNSATSNGKGPNLDPNYIHPAGDILSAGFNVELTTYNKDYDVTVLEQWQLVPWTGLATFDFQAKGFSWATPFGNGSVPDCLHGTINISYSTGTTHLVYQAVSGNYTFAATSPSSLSGTKVIQDSQRWYNGGYLRTTKTITI